MSFYLISSIETEKLKYVNIKGKCFKKLEK